MLEDTKPKTFAELLRISGFSHGTNVWLDNAQDLIKSGTAKVSEAISTRDDIMNYLIQKGVEPLLAFKTMEKVRKGKGIEPDVIEKLLKSNVPQWFIDSCLKIKYLFPKAHAVAYVMMAYRIAYCKVHYPLAYYAAYFTVRADEFDAELISQGKKYIVQAIAEINRKGNDASVKEKGLLTVLEIALEMYLRGFSMHKVNLYKSAASRFIIDQDGLLPPLGGVQGVGEVAACHIVAAREQGEFSSIEDLKNRAAISKSTIEALRACGCLNGMAETAQIELFG
jgi:DNA polymerase-3 subunit alpha (Gram-positive type)